MDSDFPGARAAFQRGMELGNVESQRRYARMLWHGIGGKKPGPGPPSLSRCVHEGAIEPALVALIVW